MFVDQVIELENARLTEALWADYHADAAAAGALPPHRVGSYFTGFVNAAGQTVGGKLWQADPSATTIVQSFKNHISTDAAIGNSLTEFEAFLSAKVSTFLRQVEKYEDRQFRLKLQEDTALEEQRADDYITTYIESKVIGVTDGMTGTDTSFVPAELCSTGPIGPPNSAGFEVRAGYLPAVPCALMEPASFDNDGTTFSIQTHIGGFPNGPEEFNQRYFMWDLDQSSTEWIMTYTGPNNTFQVNNPTEFPFTVIGGVIDKPYIMVQGSTPFALKGIRLEGMYNDGLVRLPRQLQIVGTNDNTNFVTVNDKTFIDSEYQQAARGVVWDQPFPYVEHAFANTASYSKYYIMVVQANNADMTIANFYFKI
ncbi:hypothetical protein HXX76_014128 [Chlamydomonas incerta]|uniref:Uncharacterized protein n=1 Tax=Chlamydomonas incerta TaxID=51695 RepID=A0A835SQY3_CHLIN|nr:hypothetical protein HXX76_014128 [Chlamydomonas incerta]|eukprot:KAG2424970.1 hypothetical protein HXX76_014128 [Chlamydomonas incerta]